MDRDQRALVTVPAASLRETPSREAGLADEALCGTGVELLEEEGDWRYVRTDYAYTGWVRKEELEMDLEAVSQWEAMPKRTVAVSWCHVLKAPGVRNPSLVRLPRGGQVAVWESPEDGWIKVGLPDGRSGFVPEKSVACRPLFWKEIPEETLRRSLVETALLYKGTPYFWGGKTPSGVDCSGLCFMAYWLNGVCIYRDAKLKAGFPLRSIPLAAVGKGDLLFFPGHVALYVGGNRYVHATAQPDSFGVTCNSLDPRDPLYRADLRATITAVGSLFPAGSL